MKRLSPQIYSLNNSRSVNCDDAGMLQVIVDLHEITQIQFELFIENYSSEGKVFTGDYMEENLLGCESMVKATKGTLSDNSSIELEFSTPVETVYSAALILGLLARGVNSFEFFLAFNLRTKKECHVFIATIAGGGARYYDLSEYMP